jgi:hypothetical protein
MARVLLAGLAGGAVMFLVGAITHMYLNLESRSFKRLPDEAATKEFIKQQALHPGIYDFPAMAENASQSEYERVAAAYKEGPAGFVVIAPTGQEMMGPLQLVGEFAADCIAATIAAFIIAHITLASTAFLRWILIVLLAPLSWLTLTLSFMLWYRFPWPFVLDGFLVSLLEWGLAAVAIVNIVRPLMYLRQQ